MKKAEVESFGIDALVLLCRALDISKESAYANTEYVLTVSEAEKYREYLNMRLKHTPVQYITNEAHFMGLTFYVDENVLIPRADTEILAERLIESAKTLKAPAILDLCCGSGAIGISCAHYIKNAVVTCADINEASVKIARINAANADVYGKIEFVVCDLFEELNFKQYDIIASNPPYIKSGEIDGLCGQVKAFEPRIALDGGENGLLFYEKIAAESPLYLKKNGKLLLEIGYNQAGDVCEILKENNFAEIDVFKDLAGHDRVVSAVCMEG